MYALLSSTDIDDPRALFFGYFRGLGVQIRYTSLELRTARRSTVMAALIEGLIVSNRRFHITCTAGDLFTQLALHEMHHRAQIMAMLRELGGGAAILEDLDYNALMYDRREAVS